MIAILAWGVAAYVLLLMLGDLYLIACHLRRSGPALDREQEALAHPLPAADAPQISVHLPVHNESASVALTIDALCSLDWPAERLEIMVLDDSTDHTVDIVDRRAEAWRAKGIDIKVLRRTDRHEFKAGALQEGLARSRAPYIAIFDADYRPHPLFLREIMAVLVAEPNAAFVQARLDYRNRNANWLTRAQALDLDTQLAYEQAARHWGGLPVTFNGTCGVWRRAAIEQGGGWSGRSLGEDQDLSFRVLSQGWTCRFLVSLAVAGELPASLSALTQQRRRWSTAAAQVLRVFPWGIARQLTVPRAIAFALVWLFNTTSAAAITLLAALTLAAWLWEPRSLGAASCALGAAVSLIIVLKTTGSFLAAQLLRRRIRTGYLLDVIGLWLMQAILLPVASASLLVGLSSPGGVFVRTPKKGA